MIKMYLALATLPALASSSVVRGSEPAIVLCPSAGGLVFDSVPTQGADSKLSYKNGTVCLVVQPHSCAGHGCIVPGNCSHAPSWHVAPAPGGNGNLLQMVAPGTKVCLDLNQQLGRAQAYDCGSRPAYKNQHWTTDPVKKTVSTTLPQDQSAPTLGLSTTAGCKVPGPSPGPSPPPGDYCPKMHWGKGNYDPSGPLLQPDGTWHVFPDNGHWGHCTSPDLLRWNCHHPDTGFDGDTGSISVTPEGIFALWPGVGKETGKIFRAVPATSSLDKWTTTGNACPGGGGARDPGRALKLPSGWYVPECGQGLAWFKDLSGGNMTQLKLTGALIKNGQDGITEFECPDVFALGDKVVALTSTQGRGGWTQFWVGSMSSDDLHLVPDYTGRLDYGAKGISTIYAAKTGTTTTEPFERRVLFGFSGWSTVNSCSKYYLLPQELSLSADGKLLQHPVKELEGLRQKAYQGASTLAPGSQVEVHVQCTVTALPKSGVLAVTTFLGPGQSEGVQVGYDFSKMVGFADVPKALAGSRGARRDTAPFGDSLDSSSGSIELHVFVDGTLVETFFNGQRFILTSTVNKMPTQNATSSFVNSAGLDCKVNSWTLGL